jgi:hypothetical protein
MKHLGKIMVCLAGGLVSNAVAGPDDVLAANNPYATIVARNVFSLIPPVAVSGTVSPAGPPPKITLNGIMSVFGQWQVLFKVSNASRPGQPSKEDSYILKENQWQDAIEVMRIDPLAGAVTFNNHGIVQEISLANTPVVTIPKSTAAEPVVDYASTLPKSYPPEFVRARTPDYLGGGPDGAPNGKSVPNSSLEQRVVMIEAQRAYLKSHNDPAADLLPPTAMTPSDAIAPNVTDPQNATGP